VKAKLKSAAGKCVPGALQALHRAAKKAIELGRLTGTPAFVLENGRIVDAVKRYRKKQKG
jgi:protein-disulfide isomerase